MNHDKVKAIARNLKLLAISLEDAIKEDVEATVSNSSSENIKIIGKLIFKPFRKKSGVSLGLWTSKKS